MIKRQVITEKTSSLQSKNCYTFLVDSTANKIEISKFIKIKYGVDVIKVNILKKLSKKRRRGRIEGATTQCKKAYVFTKSPIADLEESK